MTGQLRSSPYIWVSALSKLLAGDNPCEFSVWYQARFEGFDKMPSDGQLAVWSMTHTRELRKRADALIASGLKVTIEDQNKRTYRSRKGISIGFKADLMTWVGGKPQTVFDVKTGSPSNADNIQVLLEMLMIPCDAGEVYYSKTGTTVELTRELIGDEFMANLDFCLERLLQEAPAIKVSSESSCRFCKLTDRDCPERWG